MATPKHPKIGRQRPTFAVIGPYAYSYSRELITFFADYDVHFYDSQEYELELYCARRDDDTFAGKTIAQSRPRQTGKSFAARFYSLWMACIEGKRILYTCQVDATARKMYEELRDFIKSWEDFQAELKPDRKGFVETPAARGIYFENGGCIVIRTRSKSLSRGDSYDIIIYDEAQDLRQAHLDAVDAVGIASDDSQVIILGTPPGPEALGDDTYRNWHDTAHETNDGDLVWWFEWAIDYVPEDPLDEHIWYAYNPGMGTGCISDENMYAAAGRAIAAKNLEGFAREFLGYWARGVTYKALITERQWGACLIPENQAKAIKGQAAYAIKFSADGSTASIGVCLKPDDDKTPPLVDLYDHIDMTCGLLPFVDFVNNAQQTALAVVVDGAAHTQALMDLLHTHKVPTRRVKVPSARDVGAACSMFYNAVLEQNVSHVGYDDLTEVITQCKRRPIGTAGAWGFGGASEEIDQTVAEAVALAYRAAVTTKRRKTEKKKRRVVTT